MEKYKKMSAAMNLNLPLTKKPSIQRNTLFIISYILSNIGVFFFFFEKLEYLSKGSNK